MNRSNSSIRTRLSEAARDVVESITSWRLWLVLGVLETRAQYNRSLLGMFWLTAHAMAWITALAFIFSNVFSIEEDLNYFINYVSLGILFFNFMNTIITGGSEVFIKNRIIIHSHPNPLFIHPLQLVTSACHQLAYQFIAVLVFYLIFPIPLSATAIFFVPGMILTLLMAVSLSLFLSLAGARFGDFRFGMLALMRLMLFVTPVFWSLDQWAGAPLQLVTLNPVTTFLTILRAPLLGEIPDLVVYLKGIAWTVLFGVLAFGWFVRKRNTIAMWV